jgi:hypothetical protein
VEEEEQDDDNDEHLLFLVACNKASDLAMTTSLSCTFCDLDDLDPPALFGCPLFVSSLAVAVTDMGSWI